MEEWVVRKFEKFVSAVLVTVLLMVIAPWSAQPAAAATALINYPDFFNSRGLTLSGSAAAVDGVIRLTNGGTGEMGAVWSQRPISTQAPFSTTFKVSLNPTSGRADGIAFVLHSDPAGTAALPFTDCHGGGLGACYAPSYGVEFDIYRNDFDPDNNHVGVILNGEVASPYTVVATPPFDLTTAAFNAWVDYDLQTLSVYVAQDMTKPARPLLSVAVDLGLILGRDIPTTVGFTGSTGGQTAVQDIRSWQLSGTAAAGALPPPASPPTILALLPAAKPMNSPGFDLSVSGSGFGEGAEVLWINDHLNGRTSNLSTTFVSSTLLTAKVYASSLSADNFLTPTATVTVAVRNPDGQVSNSVTFTLTPLGPLYSVDCGIRVVGTCSIYLSRYATRLLDQYFSSGPNALLSDGAAGVLCAVVGAGVGSLACGILMAALVRYGAGVVEQAADDNTCVRIRYIPRRGVTQPPIPIGIFALYPKSDGYQYCRD